MTKQNADRAALLDDPDAELRAEIARWRDLNNKIEAWHIADDLARHRGEPRPSAAAGIDALHRLHAERKVAAGEILSYGVPSTLMARCEILRIAIDELAWLAKNDLENHWPHAFVFGLIAAAIRSEA